MIWLLKFAILPSFYSRNRNQSKSVHKMLTDPELKSKVDTTWDRLWSSGRSNLMDSIEQFSCLLFLKRLDDAENKREKQARLRKKEFTPQIKLELRWSHWINFKADEALKHIRDQVFPWLRTAGTEGSSLVL